MSDFLKLVRRRRSCRNYDETQPVPDHVLEHCIEAARLAPSACNRQPWQFNIVRNAETRHSLIDKGLLPGIKHDWLYNCPCLVALAITPGFVTHWLAPLISRIPYHYIDAGIAGEHFILAAAEQGVGTCWVGWIREKSVRHILKLDRQQRVVALIATGYPADPDHFQTGSPAPRKSPDQIAKWE